MSQVIPSDVIHELVRDVDVSALGRHLASLPGPRRRPADLPNIAATLEHLGQTMRSTGWAVEERNCRDVLLGAGTNLVARLPGTSRPDALVVVAAHHDTVTGSPGADDNGSGLAALLELARVLGRRRWEASIELVAFDFEESSDATGLVASFAGSRAYVAALPPQVELRGAFVYDLIGYRSEAPGSQRVPPGLEVLYPGEAKLLDARARRGDFLVALGLGTEPGNGLLERFVASAAVGAGDLQVLSFPVPQGTGLRDLFRSDHVAFWEKGLAAVMLTDTANFRNPHYHQPTDVPETLDAGFWTAVVAATLAAVATLAGPSPDC